MISPKTREQDYYSFQSDFEKVVHRFVRGKINVEESNNLVGQVWKKYKGKVFKEDFHYFDDEFSFRRALIFNFMVRPDYLENLVEHERQHFEEAKRQGLYPQYGFTAFIKDQAHPVMPYWFQAFVTVKSPTPESIKAISIAPDNPSPNDLANLK